MTTQDDQGTVGSSPETHHDLIEVAATVVLGLAVLGIAWASLQSSLWGGVQAKATTQSVLVRSDANDRLQEADGIRGLDQTLFVQFLTTCTTDTQDEATQFICDQIIRTLSPAGGEAVDAWSAGDAQLGPFQTEAYEDALYTVAGEDLAESDDEFADARQADTNSDRYETAASSFAMVLFFGGISLVIAWRRLRWILLSGASVVLVWAGVYLISLPVA
jgi:hypothetical protein